MSRKTELFRKTARRITSALTQPLVVAQGVTSAYGLLGTFVAARVLNTTEFVVFTVLTLSQGICVGLVQATVGEPSLVAMRRYPDARARLRHVAVALIPVMPVAFAIYSLAGGLAIAHAAVLTAITALPILHSWTRVRAMATRQYGLVLVSDLVRLVLSTWVSIAALMADQSQTAASLQAAYLCCAAPAALVPLWSRRVRDVSHVPYATLAPLAKWQLTEYLIAQVQTSGPLLLLAAQTTTPLVGAFRLAQSLLGPANLLYAALSTNFLAAAATSGRSDAEVIGAGRTAARDITIATSAVVFAACGVALLAPGLFPAVATTDLAIAVLCVGAAACTSASAGVHSVILRTLFLQRLVAKMRSALTLVSWVGFTVGYAIGGVSGSLVGGFLATAIANVPIVNVTAAIEYRRRQSVARSSQGL